MEQTRNNDADTLSAMDWDKLPATARVTNYPREEVETCLLQLHNKNSEVINSSQFETSFSQGGDGWEEFVEFQTYDNDNVGGSLPPFQQMLNKTNTMENTSRGARKADLLKDYYQILNSVNLDDPVVYHGIKQRLEGLSRDTRAYNEAVTNFSGVPDSGMSFFPNSTYGDNCKDKITGKRKST